MTSPQEPPDIPSKTWEVYMPRPTNEQRMALGGLAGAFGWRVTHYGPSLGEEHMTPLFSPEYQARLDAPLENVLQFTASRAIALDTDRMVAEGILTVRDVLVMGDEKLRAIRLFDASTVNRIKGALGEYFPELPLPIRVNPGLIARFCPSLEQVTWHCIATRNGLDWFASYFRGQRVSVYDILHRPQESLVKTNLPEDHQAAYSDMHSAAQLFAEEFERFQRFQRP